MGFNFQCNDFSDSKLAFFVLGYITKSMVLVSPFVKICVFFFFFPLLACRTCRSRVGEANKNRDTTRTWESGESYRFRCLYVAKNDVSVQSSQILVIVIYLVI